MPAAPGPAEGGAQGVGWGAVPARRDVRLPAGGRWWPAQPVRGSHGPPLHEQEGSKVTACTAWPQTRSQVTGATQPGCTPASLLEYSCQKGPAESHCKEVPGPPHGGTVLGVHGRGFPRPRHRQRKAGDTPGGGPHRVLFALNTLTQEPAKSEWRLRVDAGVAATESSGCVRPCCMQTVARCLGSVHDLGYRIIAARLRGSGSNLCVRERRTE